MKIYYFDENGILLGDGDSATVVENSTDKVPNTTNDKFINGEWLSPKVIPLTPEELEAQRIAFIKDKAKSIILEKYPLEKQSSAQLGIYGEVYLQEMKDYIANIIRISNEAEINGTALEDIKWVNNV